MRLSYGPDQALGADGLLRDFNAAGVLSAADVHVAQRLGSLAGEADPAVLLAVALTVRSTRHGSVVLDLATAEATTSRDDDEDDDPREPELALQWPERWAERCAASPLIGGPLRMTGSRLWLTRYWDQEALVARELLERSAVPPDFNAELLAGGLRRLFPHADDRDQQLASAVCALSRISVLAGGPGTGKTTTVSRLLALLREQDPTCRIALAAPTGKAAARLEEAVASSTAKLGDADRAALGDLPAVTLHRLLGWRPDARTRFRHDAHNRLPYEVVVVDEASMVSLTMMARLLEALRPSARLVLVGDPDQLASVEAGAVLGDLVDRATLGTRTASFAVALRSVLPAVEVAEQPESAGAGLRDGVSALSVNRRFTASSDIHGLAAAIRDGEGERALGLLRTGSPSLEFVEVDDDSQPSGAQLAGLRADVDSFGGALHEAASAGDQVGAIAALELHRVLCAHRRGPRGVQHWSGVTSGWIAAAHPTEARGDGHYVGEPLMVTSNDYEVGLFNGDTGVVVTDGQGGLVGVFGRGGAPIPVSLSRLGASRPLHAMTVHRSQGSEFRRVTVLLASADSPLSTRETLYTAVTRAEQFVRIIGSAEALLSSIGRPAARATGLRDRLHSTV
ncbi:MAG: exodeoxyribonuclease alpha subunit [Frankiales bacterium]|jgi:exodeoxyribonuclease V alpha subunit|nr:exodeoxyribonuclease alpha subunit [Frankiales bacterium]